MTRIRANSIPHKQTKCLFQDSCTILKPEQPPEYSYFQDNKHIALGYTNTYDHTYMTFFFALKMNYVLKTQIKDTYQRL